MLRCLLPLLGLLLAFFSLPAHARERDDVMAAAYRCSAVGEPRAWLDCFYGAAQPARSRLGLAPAPAEQLRLAASPPASPVAPDIAALRDSVLSGALHCYAIAQDRQWLDCYYATAQPMRARLGLSPAPQTSTPKPAAAGVATASTVLPGTGEQGFGMRAEPAAKARTDHITARMTSYSFDRHGIFTVVLANGQVWRQVSGDTGNAHWPKPAAAYVVDITHGLFGSFNLQVQDRAGLYKVDRIK